MDSASRSVWTTHPRKIIGGMLGETTLLETPMGMFDNLEGLSVWRDATGAVRATLISDDNFFVLQQTQIIEFQLPD